MFNIETIIQVIKQLWTLIAKREQIQYNQNWIVNYLKYSDEANRIMKYIKKSSIYSRLIEIRYDRLYYINDEPIRKHDLFKFILNLIYDGKYIVTIVDGNSIPITKKYLMGWKKIPCFSKKSRKLYNQIYL